VLVEQFFDFAHALGDRFVVMDRGAVKLSGTAQTIAKDDLRQAVSV
jgi:urea transport system ATP-binding protein